MSIPEKMKALVVHADKTAQVDEVPVPKIDDDEILVRVVAAAQNPTDWKHVLYLTNPGTICGCDWAGRVVDKGSKVHNVAVGDLVAGFVHGGTYKDRGSFAEYLKTPAELSWKVPVEAVSPEEASTMNCGLWTVAQAFYSPTRLGIVSLPAKVNGDQWLFVYGGSSSVGMYAIQLAKLSGFKVVTVASPKNHKLCKSLGADAVFDYKDPDAISKIREVTKNSLHLAMDTISAPETQRFSVQTFGPGSNKLLVILDIDKEAEQMRKDVKILGTLLYTCHGKAFDFAGGAHFPASPEDRAQMAEFVKKLPDLVRTGQIKPNPVKIIPGGLEGIPNGLKMMQDGLNSGQKFVTQISPSEGA